MRKRNRQVSFLRDTPERYVTPKVKHEPEIDYLNFRLKTHTPTAHLPENRRDLGEVSTRRYVAPRAAPFRPILRLARRSVSIKVEN